MHPDGSCCTASPSLAGLRPAEVAAVLDRLTQPGRDDLARIAGLPAGLPAMVLGDGLARCAGALAAPAAHEVALRLVAPLVPGLLATLASTERVVAEDLVEAVLTLLDQWPPALVRLLLVLACEAGGVSSRVLTPET